MSAWFDATLFGSVYLTLFVIMDPPGTVPLFLALTGRMSRPAMHRAALVAVLTAFGVIVAFAFFGEKVLAFLGITLPALQVSGGLLLLLVSLELLTGKTEAPEQVEDVNVALVPLGTPLLAGPGAIVATILYVRQVQAPAQAVAVAAGIVAIHLTLYLALRFAPALAALLRPAGIVILTRIAGLLLAAIAVQLVADGVHGFITAYGAG